MKCFAKVLACALAFSSTLSWALAKTAFADPPVQTTEGLAFRNELPSTFRLERVRAIVDGAALYDGKEPFTIGLAPATPHRVTVIADYRLHDPVLTYMAGFRVQVRATREITPVNGRGVTLVAVAAPRGGVTTPIERQAVIGWEEQLR